MLDFIKLIQELREMGQKLPSWRFLLIWSVFFLFGLASFVHAIRWW